LPPPRISIVTPSFNQGAFLEETMRSVLDQNYPDLEYVVIDGGSSDNSVEVIKKYADRLTFWSSEKDNGHFDGLNKGFARTTGEVMAWINSDDKYCPWCLSVVGEIFGKFPQVEWLTTRYPIHWDAQGRAIRCKELTGFTKRSYLAGEHLPRPGANSTPFIQQESTFWRRSLWGKAGGRCDASIGIAGDFELWARFFEHAPLYTVTTPLGGFRTHGEQFSAKQMDRYIRICLDVMTVHGGRQHGKLANAMIGPRGQKYIPHTILRMFNLADDDVKIVTHAGGDRGWEIRTVRSTS
jgi:hypothetical protein